MTEQTVSKTYSLTANGATTITISASDFGLTKISALKGYYTTSEFTLLLDKLLSSGKYGGFKIADDGSSISFYLYNSKSATTSGTLVVTVI